MVAARVLHGACSRSLCDIGLAITVFKTGLVLFCAGDHRVSRPRALPDDAWAFCGTLDDVLHAGTLQSPRLLADCGLNFAERQRAGVASCVLRDFQFGYQQH